MRQLAFGPCPHCGVLTKGTHIAGTVYDYQCDPCAERLDADFDSFIAAAVAYAAAPEGDTNGE